jgi:hypothetical protein
MRGTSGPVKQEMVGMAPSESTVRYARASRSNFALKDSYGLPLSQIDRIFPTPTAGVGTLTRFAAPAGSFHEPTGQISTPSSRQKCGCHQDQHVGRRRESP